MIKFDEDWTPPEGFWTAEDCLQLFEKAFRFNLINEDEKKNLIKLNEDADGDGDDADDAVDSLDEEIKKLKDALENIPDLEEKNDLPQNKASIKDSVINRSTVINVGKIEVKDKDALEKIFDKEELYHTTDEIRKALDKQPLKENILNILDLIDSKINREKVLGDHDEHINWEEREKGASQSDFLSVIEICDKQLLENSNPYIWAIKGYCVAMNGNYDLGVELILKSFQLAYDKPSELNEKGHDNFRKYLFDNRNLLLCIDSENRYVVESKKIATIGRVNSVDGGRFRHIKNDDKFRDSIREDYYDISYRIERRDLFEADGIKSNHLPEYVFIPKIKGKTLKNYEQKINLYSPIQQFLEENKITQREAVRIFTEFKELYPIFEGDYVKKGSSLLKRYRHENESNGGSFLIFLKTLTDQIIEVLESKISDIEIDDSEMQEVTKKIMLARIDIHAEKSERRRKLNESKPGFWESYLTDGDADSKWESKAYENDWENFFSDMSTDITKNWDHYIENTVANNSEKIIAYKHKINEVGALRKSLTLFGQTPLKLKTNKMRTFISNYELMKKNIDIYETLTQLEKSYQYELSTRGIGDTDLADSLWEIYFNYTRNMLKFTNDYFHSYNGTYYLSEHGETMGFAINQYESTIEDYTKLVEDFNDNREEFLKYVGNIFNYNEKKMNTALFTASDLNSKGKIEIQNGTLLKVDSENTNLNLNFCWYTNNKYYPKR